MIAKKIKVKSNPYLLPNILFISHDLLSTLNLQEGQKIILLAGNKETEVFLKSDTKINNTIMLSSQTGIDLCIPSDLDFELNLKLTHSPQTTIRLGPFIGIYGYRKQNTSKRIFSEQTSYFRMLCNTARLKGAVAYVIAPDDINFEEGFTFSHVLESSPTGPIWSRKKLPLPDIFYDRGLFPKGPNKKQSMLTRRYLRQAWGEKFFNPKYFNKWRTHKWLAQNPILLQYLPDTESLRSLELPFHFLERFSSIYLKPAGGSSGHGILRVQKNADQYICEFSKRKQHHQWGFEDANQLWTTLLNNSMVNKTYIVQEDLHLATYNSRPFDIRVLVQKDSTGQWGCTGMAARIAGEKGITSNLHAGGTAEKIDVVLTKLFGKQKANTIERKIDIISRLCCTWVEKISGLMFGEIAVDVGLSNSGKLWIIELNAVPGRTVFRKTGDMETRKVAISRPIEYALHLAGF